MGVGQAHVGAHALATLKQDHISGDEVLARDFARGAITHDTAVRAEHRLERLDGALSAPFLDEPQDGIEHDDGGDDRRVEPLSRPP